jgi:TonB family protein
VFLVAALSALVGVPLGNPGEWVSTDDYPQIALQQELQGTVGFKLTIAKDGVPQACDIEQSSGHAVLDETTCKLLVQRARFAPDNAASSYRSRVSWRIPQPPKIPLTMHGYLASAKVEHGELAGDCVDQVIGQPPDVLTLCEMFEDGEKLQSREFIDFSAISEIHFRLLIAPAEAELTVPPGASPGLQRQMLFKADFDVDSLGRVSRCQILEDRIGSGFDELCSQFDPNLSEFDVSSASTFPVKMMFTLDILTK